MKEISRDEIIKEYEDYIDNTTFETNQIEIIGDSSNGIEELARLYEKILKDFIKHNDEEGEKSIELYITKIMEVSNIKGAYHIKTVKDNIILKIKQQITKTEVAIEKILKNLSWFEIQLTNLKLSDDERNIVSKNKDILMKEKYNVLSNFTNSISAEIKSEITKIKRKNKAKSVLKAVAMGTATALGIFLTSKIQTIAKDAGLDLVVEKEDNDDIRDGKSTIAAESLRCINDEKSLNKDITPNM